MLGTGLEQRVAGSGVECSHCLRLAASRHWSQQRLPLSGGPPTLVAPLQ